MLAFRSGGATEEQRGGRCLASWSQFRTACTGGANAVASGIFFGCVGQDTTAPTARAAFVRTDSTAQGTWQGLFGTEGYHVIGDAASYPAYATLTQTGGSLWTWASPTDDPRALQRATENWDSHLFSARPSENWDSHLFSARP